MFQCLENLLYDLVTQLDIDLGIAYNRIAYNQKVSSFVSNQRILFNLIDTLIDTLIPPPGQAYDLKLK